MSSTIDSIDIHCPFDAHLHLRQPGQLLELVVTQITTGGIQSAHVMHSWSHHQLDQMCRIMRDLLSGFRSDERGKSDIEFTWRSPM
ncbi:hypothetical protein PGT21_026040 [Puccinia graminis f. sp. tritici]|uniref:Dihydroorotase n=1 Tax=Puccinia graminis f. sp. tritici TaxID=56615 RepID=A0A5B0N3L1_PUCGR|nr:hypothetical protein PGT21_026040 [Puccinia graminis f. sp. tritici]